jgi:hypothetical protein
MESRKFFELKFCSLLIIVIASTVAINESARFEKFFEIEGGPQYMYYFSKIKVGSPGFEQSAIIDTGSDTLAFPCDDCRSGDCGTHQDPRFSTKASSTFALDFDCPSRVFFQDQQMCRFIKSYAEGSSLLGFLATDYVKFKNARKVSDPKLQQLNAVGMKNLKLKAEFGCTTKETGLFVTQYADGILGLDNNSSFIESIEKQNSKEEEKIFSFGLCFSNTGGIMSVDLRSRNAEDEKLDLLNRQIGEFEEPIVVPYISYNSYYELNVTNFQIGQTTIDTPPITMMVDSGTTFSHFPTWYITKILKALTDFCVENKNQCGMLPQPHFTTSTCLVLTQPDDHYKNIDELFDSFPDILIHLDGQSRPYVLKPKNYFYIEFQDKPSPDKTRICMALKGEEDSQIILGAFSMIDNFFYFDRKQKKLKIYKEDCYVRTQELLKRRERILEATIIPTNIHHEKLIGIAVAAIGVIALLALVVYKRRKQQRDPASKLNIPLTIY